MCLLGFLSLLIAIGYGVLVRQELVGTTKLGLVSKTALFFAEIPANLHSILTGEGQTNDLRVKEKRRHLKVKRFKNKSGFQGSPLEREIYLLLARYDGNEERSIVELIDLRTFEIIKIWKPDIDKINDLADTSLPEHQHLKRDKHSKRYLMTHPFLTEDGGLIFQHSSPLVRIDENSKLVWQNDTDQFHHSLEQDHEGNFWVPTHAFPYQLDKKHVGLKHGNFLDDAITKVSPNGEVLFQKSVSNILLENNMKLFDRRWIHDPIHLNDIQPVLSDGPYWKQGDLFLSLPLKSSVILYRRSTNKIIWMGRDHTSSQHDVNILDDHRISIFNNNNIAYFKKNEVDDHSEIVIYNFKTDEYSKYLDKSLKQNDVRSFSQSRGKITNNNDLFIEEQNYGRLLFFNKDGSLQWEYINRAKDDYVYALNWSRILFTDVDINKVKKILELEDKK